MSGAAHPLAAPVLRAAELSDVEAMAAMINRYASLGLMLPKSEAELYRFFREYVVVAGPEGEVVGCGGLRVYRPGLAEIVGLAVHEDWQGRGIGGLVVDRLIAAAEALGIGRVFAMTLEEGFFHRRGFRALPRTELPEKVAADCRGCARRSGCREIAVMRVLQEVEPVTGAEPRRLRVLQA